MKAKIVEIKQSVGTTLENTNISQREKLEETMINLATVLGEREIKRARIQDGSYVYSVGDAWYQRASNTILTLSRRVAEA